MNDRGQNSRQQFLPPQQTGGRRPPRGPTATTTSTRKDANMAKTATTTPGTNNSSTRTKIEPLPSSFRNPAPRQSSSSNERTRLLQQNSMNRLNANNSVSFRHDHHCTSISCLSATGVIIMSLIIFIGVFVTTDDDDINTGLSSYLLHLGPPPYYKFPSNFTWGVATSSYQIEGAVHEDGRGTTIWDTFCLRPGATLNGRDGSVACDHYHKVKEDVELMASLNIKAYRFSIAWSRIMPNGTGPVNEPGLAFYNHLIDTLLGHEIEPWVTLFHWDLPQTLQDKYGGWMDTRTAEAFAEYAGVCFEAFGDRVSHWITVNEAWTVSVNGYGTGIHAPGHQSATEPYQVGHNLLLGHGLAVRAFRDYQNRTNTNETSMIGISNCGDFRYPLTVADHDTAERVMLFQMGWFTDPLYMGDYPTVMRERLGDRLPTFTADERDLLIGSVDFIGLNYYSSLQASTPKAPPSYTGYWTDIDANLQSHPDWRHNDMNWPVVPDGLRNMLRWVSERYETPLIYITENGDAEHEPTLAKALVDTQRQNYLTGHLRAVGQSLEAGYRVGGYFAWTLMDNFEWQFSYERKFGLCHVDFKSGKLTRTPKGSAILYNHTIVHHGRNIVRDLPKSWFPSVRRQ